MRKKGTIFVKIIFFLFFFENTSNRVAQKKTSLISNFNYFYCTQTVKLKFCTDIYYINVDPL